MLGKLKADALYSASEICNELNPDHWSVVLKTADVIRDLVQEAERVTVESELRRQALLEEMQKSGEQAAIKAELVAAIERSMRGDWTVCGDIQLLELLERAKA